jgi:hypothetical protein
MSNKKTATKTKNTKAAAVKTSASKPAPAKVAVARGPGKALKAVLGAFKGASDPLPAAVIADKAGGSNPNGIRAILARGVDGGYLSSVALTASQKAAYKPATGRPPETGYKLTAKGRAAA